MQVDMLVAVLFVFSFFLIDLSEQEQGRAMLEGSDREEASKVDRLRLAAFGQTLKAHQAEILVKLGCIIGIALVKE